MVKIKNIKFENDVYYIEHEKGIYKLENNGVMASDDNIKWWELSDCLEEYLVRCNQECEKIFNFIKSFHKNKNDNYCGYRVALGEDEIDEENLIFDIRIRTIDAHSEFLIIRIYQNKRTASILGAELIFDIYRGVDGFRLDISKSINLNLGFDFEYQIQDIIEAHINNDPASLLKIIKNIYNNSILGLEKWYEL